MRHGIWDITILLYFVSKRVLLLYHQLCRLKEGCTFTAFCYTGEEKGINGQDTSLCMTHCVPGSHAQ